MWDVAEAFVLTSGTVPSDLERTSSLAARLAAADPAEIHRTSFIPPYEDLTVAFAAFQRDYSLALLRLDLELLGRARELLESMKGRDGFHGLGSVKRDAEPHLEAELLVRSGDRRGALAVLRDVEGQVPHASTVWPLADMGRARFLRAELERELGDVETARRFYVGLDEPWSPWDGYWRPLVYEWMGRLAEEAGRTEEAVRYYGRLVELWSECDPELVPTRKEIGARLEGLLGGPPLG